MAERSEELERLLAQAGVRPGDPVVRAQVAVALAKVPTDAGEVDEAVTSAIGLARTCLELGIVGPASEAAQLLFERFGGERAPEIDAATATEVELLMADITLQRDGGKDIEAARELLEAVVAARPDAVGARIRAGALALGLGQVEAARRWVEPVARATVQTRSLYVQVLLALGAADDAATEAILAIEQAPDVSVLHQLLGIAELTRGDVEAAIAALSEGLRLAPDDPVAYYNLSLAFEATGSKLAALGVADAGLELAPGNPRLEALKARLGRVD